MTLEDIVEKLFVDNPDLSEDEAVKTLKEMKDPKTNKSMWKSATIRNRVNTHLRKNGGDTNILIDESNKPPVETMGSGSDLKVEGKEIERHKPKDPFAIEQTDATDVGKIVDQMKDEENTVDIDELKIEIVDDVSKKVLEQVSTDAKSFKEETISIIGDLKSSMVDVITDMKKEMVDIQKQNLPNYEPVVEYDDIKLKKSTIDIIQKNTEEKELKEESEYIDSLIENEKEYTSILQFYHKLIDLTKGAKKGVQLRLFYENDKLSYDKKPVGRFGISLKSLLAGVGIGVVIVIAIILIYTALTGTPPPILPAAPIVP